MEDIGCIAWTIKHDATILSYKFYSLFNEEDRQRISELVKTNTGQKTIINFENNKKPIYSHYLKNILYFTNYFNLVNNKCANKRTSIVKLSTKTLKCVEIYQSKFEIIHFTMNDQ